MILKCPYCKYTEDTNEIDIGYLDEVWRILICPYCDESYHAKIVWEGINTYIDTKEMVSD